VSTITTSVTGSTQAIAFSVTGMPIGMTATFSSPSVNAGNSVVILVSTTTVVTGTYPLIVTGTVGSLQRSTAVSVVVSSATTSTTNDFTLTPNPANVQVAQGGTVTTTITANTASGSVASTVNFTVVGQQPGMTASLNSSSVTTGGSVVLTINGGTALVGTFPLIIIAQNASMAHTATVVVTVTGTNTSGSGSANGTSCTVNNQCISGMCTNNICVGKPNGAPCDRSRECVSETCSMNYCQSPGGNVSAFKLTLSSVSLNVQAGSPGAVNVAVDNTVAGADVQQVTLTAAVVGGFVTTFSPSVVKTGGSSVLYIDIPLGTPAGNYALLITGVSGSLPATAVLVVAVGAVTASTDDFSFVTNPSTFTLTELVREQDVAVNLLRGGNPITVNLTYSGAPAGMIVLPGTYTSRSGDSFPVTVRVGQAVPGTYRIIITGKGGEVTHTTVLTVIIAPANSGGGGTGGTGGAVGTSCTANSQCSSNFCSVVNSVCIDTTGSAICAASATTEPVQCWNSAGQFIGSGQSMNAGAPFCCTSDATALTVPVNTSGQCTGRSSGPFHSIMSNSSSFGCN
jgi:hypothetical protein